MLECLGFDYPGTLYVAAATRKRLAVLASYFE
jgi:hypothetical protein